VEEEGGENSSTEDTEQSRDTPDILRSLVSTRNCLILAHIVFMTYPDLLRAFCNDEIGQGQIQLCVNRFKEQVEALWFFV